MESNYKLINPYSLLGVKNTCSLSYLKKNYYNLSLLTHPDKGGSQSDFSVVHFAYQYIKKQLENIRETTYEELEDEFDDFCQKQERIKPPCFYDVFQETNDWIKTFNEEFEKQYDTELTESYNPLDKGYGNLLDTSNVKFDYEENEVIENKTLFSQEIIKYTEPNYLPDSVVQFPLDNTEITDFSNLSDNLKSADYKLTHSQTNNLEEEFKNLGLTKEIKDYPKENLEYNFH